MEAAHEERNLTYETSKTAKGFNSKADDIDAINDERSLSKTIKVINYRVDNEKALSDEQVLSKTMENFSSKVNDVH